MRGCHAQGAWSSISGREWIWKSKIIHPYRPAHLHYIIKADGFETLTTHIFDPDDPYIHSDAVFGVKESLLAEFRLMDDPACAKELGFDGKFWKVEHDFVLAPSR